MKLKSVSILAGIAAIAIAFPLTAQACGNKDRNPEANAPEGTQTSQVETSSYL